MMENTPVCRRGDLSDEAWEKIAYLLPQGGQRGGR